MTRTISDTVTEISSLRHGIENAAWEEARGKLMAYLRLRGSRFGRDHEEYDALKNVIEKFIERIDEDDIYSPDPDEITRLSEENARLREENENIQAANRYGKDWVDQASQEITRLREENARLRETLQYIADPYNNSTTSKDRLAFLARAAIREGGKDD